MQNTGGWLKLCQIPITKICKLLSATLKSTHLKFQPHPPGADDLRPNSNINVAPLATLLRATIADKLVSGPPYWHNSTVMPLDETTILAPQAGKLKFFGTRLNWAVSYTAYTKFHLPRPVLHSRGHIFTRIGERASSSFPACTPLLIPCWGYRNGIPLFTLCWDYYYTGTPLFRWLSARLQ